MNLPESNSTQVNPKKFRLPSWPWIFDLLLVGVLLFGAYLRFVGVNWDDVYHLHPDERFLTMVESGIEPVHSLSEYFDTATSTLNPNNRGYGFYVYGTLPLIMVRYIGEWVGKTGYGEIHLVGRVVSGLLDLGTILLAYLIAKRLYKNSRLGLVAALLLAVSVVPIQLSHFFTVDTYTNFFVYLAIFFAVTILNPAREPETGEGPLMGESTYWLKTNWKSLTSYALFGVAYGMALACKVSIWSLMLLLPLAAFIHYLRLSPEQREYELPILARNLVLGGIFAFLTFRVFQPYAFTGPSFLNFSINPQWISSLKELSNISAGNVDVPYAIQWTRRPLSFVFENYFKWGVGPVYAILSIAAMLWMAWRMIKVKDNWQKHILLWVWVVIIFLSQTFAFSRNMRYLIPIYPAVAIISAWAIFKLWEEGQSEARKIARISFNWRRALSVVAAVVVIGATGAYAIAFSNIYTRPVTRVAASEWVLKNIPGAINIKLSSDSGSVNQPLAYQNGVQINANSPYTYAFKPTGSGYLSQVDLAHVLNIQPQGANLTLVATIYERDGSERKFLGSGFLQSTYAGQSDSMGDETLITMSEPVEVDAANTYEIVFEVAESDGILQLMGDITLGYTSGTTITPQQLPQPEFALKPGAPYSVVFTAVANGKVDGVTLNRVVDLLANPQAKTLRVTLFDMSLPDQPIINGSLQDTFSVTTDIRGDEKTLQFTQPVDLAKDHVYKLQFDVESLTDQSDFALAFYNNMLAIESSWDDALPLSMYGYNIWDNAFGLYGNKNNLEIYWKDDDNKVKRLTNILDETDTILISSNRQWATTTRIPERYPLTISYYRNLLGCPEDKDLLWCYQVAQPGMFKSNFGFELTQVFESDPNLGNFKINDQSAEESFTVYDHPKVFVFQKTADYDAAKVQAVLSAVDTSNVVVASPAQASKFSGNLQLTDAQKQVQQSGGTWTDIFNPFTLVNQNQWVAAFAWYLLILLLGLIVYPFVRWALKALPDHGYPFSRLVGMLLLALITWLASSSGAHFTRATIAVVLGLLIVVNLVLAFWQREELAEEWRTKKKYFLAVEAVFLLFFLIDLGIRLGNPDLWHPWKGGEKPMDLSYFTAVLKSTTFPAFDPWYAGGYINYYYYGFVVVGVPVKFLGIVPYMAYNLVLPTLFALTAVGAFSIVWNLLRGFTPDPVDDEGAANRRALTGGLIGSLSVLIIGNLGTLRMLWQGLQRLAAPGGTIEDVSVIQRWLWFFEGLSKYIDGSKLPYGTGDWYWIPSRALPGDVITEFPFFTFTYADLHAHMIALPITLLAIGWALAILLGRWQWAKERRAKWTQFISCFVLGGVVIGALRPTNTWDLPTYLALACVVILYTIIRYADLPAWFLPKLDEWLRRVLYALGAIAFLGALLYIFYLPFTKWYGQAYGSIEKWSGDTSPMASYLTHWGLFFFVITTWFVWETRQWMAETPVSALQKLKKYAIYLEILAGLTVIVLIMFALLGIHIIWVAMPLALWALILIMRPGQPDVKRFVLFMIGTALFLTIFVELFNLVGDIGRMNTVFKFYYQAWTLLALSSAVALVWLAPAVVNDWGNKTSISWQIVLAFLVFGGLLYPITAAQDKIDDRMNTAAPHSLDGMAFMIGSTYGDQDTIFDLAQDYDGIKWMQANVQGSPVIVEGNTVEYRWGNRYTIYTGLPGVLGWNWHQRQQRGFLNIDSINARLAEIPDFYKTTNVNDALKFIKKYDVKYIIVGQLERAYYPGDGLLKFETFNGTYWKEVFREKDTVIYEVMAQ
jgi:YYY domain-containing protein